MDDEEVFLSQVEPARGEDALDAQRAGPTADLHSYVRRFTQREARHVLDPVQGLIHLSGLASDVIDTPQFQRLRDLKQLGTTYGIYIGASHNRFEHSLGTYHLASQVMAKIYIAQRKELDLTPFDLTAVSLAGLCHDLGHGPFSHMFDNEFLPRRGIAKDVFGRTHEQRSTMMIDSIADELNYDVGDEWRDIVSTVKHLITSGDSAEPKSMGGIPDRKAFLRDVVANGRNSVDVDKFDYIERDSINTGVKSSCDFTRLKRFNKVIGDQICYRISEVNNLYNLFHTRAQLHNTVYTHKKGKALEYMLTDALIEADVVYNGEYSKSITDMQEYVKLDDTVIKRIEWDPDPRLAKAQAIIKRVRKRELYRFVNEFTVPTDQLQKWEKVSPEEILAHQGVSRVPGGLRPEDIIVQNLKIDWTKGEDNPVEHVRFFKEGDDESSFTVPRDKLTSCMYPASFLAKKVRIFTRSRSEEHVEAAAQAFSNYQQHRFRTQQQIHETPVKKRARSDTTPGCTPEHALAVRQRQRQLY